VVQALLDLDRARPRPCRLFVVDGAKGLTKATVLAITMIIAGTAETVGVFLHHAGQSGDARVGQNRPKLTCCQASSTIAVGTAAGNVVYPDSQRIRRNSLPNGAIRILPSE